VYVCAQDRDDEDAPPDGGDRLLCLINAPADGDKKNYSEAEIAGWSRKMWSRLQACGLQVQPPETPPTVTTPDTFNALFRGTGGALYGQAVHGSMATFRRPGAATRIPGLYLAGGATHPGAGVPMAALSGRLAAARVIADGVLMRR
jgi:1-hydroxycarotenoid 3,4-desaturase